MVDDQQAVTRWISGSRYRQIGDVIVVVAELQAVSCGRRLPHRIEGRRSRQHRIAPADQDLGVVALGDVVLLVDAGADFLEAEADAVLGLRPVGGRNRKRADGRRDGRHAERALDQVAPAETGGDDVAKGEGLLLALRPTSSEASKAWARVGGTVSMAVNRAFAGE